MSRFLKWISRPLSGVARRALDETVADAAFEQRHAGSAGERVRARAQSVAAHTRLLGAALMSSPREPLMRNYGRDVRYAWRRLVRTPLFSLFAVITLAAGIGATTAIYSVVHAVLGPPPGVTGVERIVNLYHYPRGNPASMGLSWPDYQDFRARQTSFERVMAWSPFGAAIAANGQSVTMFAEMIGGDYFGILGIAPLRGRLLQPADEAPQAPPVAVISYGAWQRFFAGDEQVAGKVIKINGQMVEVVGVAPAAFHGLFNNGLVPTAVWVPLSSARVVGRTGMRASLDPIDRDQRWLLVKGTLKPGTTIEQAAAEVAAFGKQLDADFPIGRTVPSRYAAPSDTSRPWTVKPMAAVRINESDVWIVDGLAAAVMLAVGVVLLIACTNLANLALARGSERRQELSVRLALGASRWRLVREALTESAMLAGAGAILGLGLARVLIVMMSGELSLSGTIAVLSVAPRLDANVLTLSALATLLALAIAGLGPALQSTRADVRTALAADGSTTAAPRWRGRRILIAAQVTASVILLSVTALAVTQLRSSTQQDPGFDLAHLAVADVDFESQSYDRVQADRVTADALARLRGRPDIVAAAAASGMPIGISAPSVSVDRAYVRFIQATPSIFATLDVKIVRGRGWSDAEAQRRAPVAVVSELAARRFFGSIDAVGQTVSYRRPGDNMPTEQLQVVGVSADTDVDGPGRRTTPLIFAPFDAAYDGRRVVFLARATSDPAPLVGALRQTLRQVDRDLAIRVADVGLEAGGTSTQFYTITAGITGVLGTFAWILALAGLYGVLSHLVLRRMREMGVRVALGASRRDIIRLVLREGLSPVLAGVVAGLILGAIARLSLQARFLRLVPAIDVLALAIVPALFVAVAAVACYLPARRAARVDPAVALRSL